MVILIVEFVCRMYQQLRALLYAQGILYYRTLFSPAIWPLTALNKGSIWPQYMGHDIWDTLYNIYIYTINRCYCGLHQIVLSLLFVNKAKSYNHIQLHVGISGPLRITFDKVSINHFSLKTIFRKWYKSRYNSFIEKFTWYLVILHF